MNLTSQKLKIKLFGEKWVLMKIELNTIEHEYFSKIASSLKLPLHQGLLDPFFYHHLRLNSISSIDNIPCKKVGGLLNSSSNQLEIWLNGKKIQKITIPELEPTQYLFPLYQVKKALIANTNQEGIYIEQKEMGFIGSFETMVNDFSIDDLNFFLIEIKNHLLLENITHKHSKMVFKKRETLITYQNSYEVNS